MKEKQKRKNISNNKEKSHFSALVTGNILSTTDLNHQNNHRGYIIIHIKKEADIKY